MSPASDVRHVLFYTPLRPGNLMLCECVDGSVWIFRDDEPVPGCRWETAATARAVAVYFEMRQALTGGPT